MLSQGNPNLKKYISCEEWMIEEKDIKIEVLESSSKPNSLGPFKGEINFQANNKMTEDKPPAKSRQCQITKRIKNASPKLKTFFQSLKRNKDQTEYKEKVRLGFTNNSSLPKSNNTSKQSILKNLRHIVKSRQDKGTDNYHKKHKHRYKHNKKEHSKKKRKLDKLKRRLKREGALLNIKMDHEHKTKDSASKGQLIDQNDNHGRFTNLSCNVLPISSSRTLGRTSECSLFRPCLQLYNNPSILWDRRIDSKSLGHPPVLKQAATSSFGLLESKQFNNSSRFKHSEDEGIEFTNCPQPPVMYTPLCCPRVENMRTYGLKRVTDAFCCNCDFWDFEKDPCLLDPFHYHDLSHDFKMKFNPVNKMCKRKQFLSSPTGVIMEPRNNFGIGEGRNSSICCERKDSISSLVNNVLRSRNGSPMCCPKTPRCQPACVCPPKNCCCVQIPRQKNVNRCTQPRIQPMQCCCRQKEQKGGCCRSRGCNKRSSCCCEPMMMETCICCPDDSCGCVYETFCNNEGKQFWRTPVNCRNRIFERSLARDKSCCSNRCSRFITLRPRCSKCIKKVFDQ